MLGLHCVTGLVAGHKEDASAQMNSGFIARLPNRRLKGFRVRVTLNPKPESQLSTFTCMPSLPRQGLGRGATH